MDSPVTAKRSNGQESKIDFGTVVSMLKDGEDVVYVISHDASDVRYANPADLKILPIEAINLPIEIDPWMKHVPTNHRILFLDALQSASKMKRTSLNLQVQQEGGLPARGFRHHVRIGFTTSPAISVNRYCRPWNLYVRRSWSIPRQ